MALKVLPEAFTSDPDRLARFEREAKVLASLNHPNIAAIYGFEEDESEGTRALVLELVEGPTLADRIAQGPIPVDEALPIAKQIAEALEAAHEQGIIHRDLKPANIKLRPDGAVKVLDFGLAKALAGDGPAGGLSDSPTITAMATATGIILGTAAYMSPEQAKGKAVDRRTDVWAFGAVLYEMLTGQRAFQGPNTSETLVAVLTADVALDGLPESTPGRLRQLLRTCLQKDTKRRARDIGDVRLAMEGAFESAVDVATADDATRPRLTISAGVAIAVTALVVGVLIDRAMFRSTDAVPAQGLTRVSVNLGPRQHLSGGFGLEERLQRPSRRSVVLSPDGRHLVYAASDGATTQLYRRRMDQSQATPIPETEGASSPFFAPDGESVGFVVALPTASPHRIDGQTQVKRMSIDSGEVRTIATSGPEFAPAGASWTAHETILLPSGDAIYEVPANGGSLSRLTTFESTQGERLLYPELLPGGRAVLYNVALGEVPSQWDIVVESLDTGRRRVVVEGGSDPRYVSSGHIVFVRTGSLMAVPFDVRRLEVTGAPVVAVEDVMQAERGTDSSLNSGAGQFSVSDSGSLAYVPGGLYPVPEASLVWVDRNGASEPIPVPPGNYLHPRVSPDGTRLAYSEGPRGDHQVWVYDIGLEVPVQLPTAGENAAFVWSPDSTRLAFMSTGEGGTYRMLSMAADGSGQPQRLTEGEALPSSW